MKFLYAEFRSPENGPDVLRGQWVIPAPHLENVFVDIVEGQTCLVAEVRSGFDPDTALDALCNIYTGLPRALLSHYILHTAVQLNSGDYNPPIGTRFRIFCDQTQAKLLEMDTQRMLLLWENFETEKYL